MPPETCRSLTGRREARERTIDKTQQGGGEQHTSEVGGQTTAAMWMTEVLREAYSGGQAAPVFPISPPDD